MRLGLSSEMGAAALTRLPLCPPPGLHACFAENLCIGHRPDVIAARHPAHLSAPRCAERDTLLQQGFSNWMRRDFNAFVRAVSDNWGWLLVAVKGLLLCLRPAVESAARCTPTGDQLGRSAGCRAFLKMCFHLAPPPALQCEKYGRHALSDIAREIESKTEEEVRGRGSAGRGTAHSVAPAHSALRSCCVCAVQPLDPDSPPSTHDPPLTCCLACCPHCLPQVRAYAKVFWERYTEINDHEKVSRRGGGGGCGLGGAPDSCPDLAAGGCFGRGFGSVGV